MVNKVLIGTLLIFVGAVASLFLIEKINSRKVSGDSFLEESLVSLSSQTDTVPLAVSEAIINKALEEYLPKVLKAQFGGRVFCSHYLYGYDEEKEKSEVFAYVWVYCEEYYKAGPSLKMGSGVSMPVKVVLKLQSGKLGVQGHVAPQDGEGYTSSIKAMFPGEYASEAIIGYDVSKFSPSPKFQAEEYFK